jgi:hypothetical protein
MDQTLAWEWLQKAAANGFEQAQEMMTAHTASLAQAEDASKKE